MNQGHENLPAHLFDLPDRLLNLGVLALVSHLLDPMVYPRSRVALLFGDRLVVLYDLGDRLKIGAQLGLGPGTPHPVTGWLRMSLNFLQSIPVDTLPAHHLPLAGLIVPQFQTYLGPPVHVSVHPLRASGKNPIDTEGHSMRVSRFSIAMKNVTAFGRHLHPANDLSRPAQKLGGGERKNHGQSDPCRGRWSETVAKRHTGLRAKRKVFEKRSTY